MGYSKKQVDGWAANDFSYGNYTDEASICRVIVYSILAILIACLVKNGSF